MKNTERNVNILNLMSFVALIIVAILVIVNQLLPVVGIETTGPFFHVLETIEKLFTVIVIGISAYNFVANKGKGLKITYWVAVALFIAGIVLIWFK